MVGSIVATIVLACGVTYLILQQRAIDHTLDIIFTDASNAAQDSWSAKEYSRQAADDIGEVSRKVDNVCASIEYC